MIDPYRNYEARGWKENITRHHGWKRPCCAWVVRDSVFRFVRLPNEIDYKLNKWRVSP